MCYQACGFQWHCDLKASLRKDIFLSYASLLTLIGACTMAPSACSHLSLSSRFKICGIAIEDDNKWSREMEVNHDDLKVMGVLKSVLDGECADNDLLPKLLKMNKGKLIKCILTLIP
jgi:L-serine deaminase